MQHDTNLNYLFPDYVQKQLCLPLWHIWIKLFNTMKLQTASEGESGQVHRKRNFKCHSLAHEGTFLPGEEKELFWKFSYCSERCFFFAVCIHLVETKYNLVLSMKYVTIQKIQIPDLRALQELLQEYPLMCASFSIALIKKIYRRILSIWK